jgi:hypothetical protein
MLERGGALHAVGVGGELARTGGDSPVDREEVQAPHARECVDEEGSAETRALGPLGAALVECP